MQLNKLPAVAQEIAYESLNLILNNATALELARMINTAFAEFYFPSFSIDPIIFGADDIENEILKITDEGSFGTITPLTDTHKNNPVQK